MDAAEFNAIDPISSELEDVQLATLSDSTHRGSESIVQTDHNLIKPT